MDISSRRPHSKRKASGKHSRKGWLLVLLAGFLSLILALTVQLLDVARQDNTFTAYSAPITHLDASPSPTTPVGPPTLTLSVPSSGQGPMGAHVTVIGSNWATSDVLAGIAAPGAACADPNSWAHILHVRPQSDGSIIFSFAWPTDLTITGSPYSICASSPAGVANVGYQLLTASPPTLTLNPTTTNAGSIVAVSGANFLGSGSVTLSVTNATAVTHELTTLSPDANGAFELSYQPRSTELGDITLRAFTSAPQGMRPALDVTAKLHVDPALTPTPGETPTASVIAPTQKNGDSTAIVIVVVVASILLALLVTGSILFFMVRNRRNSAGDAGYDAGHYGGSGPGYGPPGNMYADMYQDNGYGSAGNAGNPGWDAPTQDLSTYHANGYPPQSSYGNDASGWRQSDEPDPDWRPRPMTGQWHAPEGYADAPSGGYGADASGNYPPRDPWGDPESSYNQPGQPHGTNQSYGGASRGGGYPPPDPRSRGSGGTRGTPRDRDRYPDEPPDDDW
ncbi:MAG TPA: hypothetical protein VGF38_15015 [Ktedonobacterales bacterium]|jgi:hypothetical protein